MIRTLFLSSLLAIAGVAAPAQAAEPAKPTVAVEVDVSALPDEEFTRYLKRDLTERQVRILADGGLEVADDANATIRVVVSRYGDHDVHYRFTVALFEGDAETPKVERTLSCELCKDSELVTKVGEEVARVSGRLLFEPEARPEDSPGPQPEHPEGSANDGTTPPSERDPVHPPGKRIGIAGYSGIAALPIGVGLMVGGVVALTKEPTVRIPPDRTPEEEVITHRRLGISLTTAGAVVAAAGVVLIVVDQTVLRKRRSERRAAAILHPSISPAGLGVSLTGRF